MPCTALVASTDKTAIMAMQVLCILCEQDLGHQVLSYPACCW
jgi:hypothetical protein